MLCVVCVSKVRNTGGWLHFFKLLCFIMRPSKIRIVKPSKSQHKNIKTTFFTTAWSHNITMVSWWLILCLSGALVQTLKSFFVFVCVSARCLSTNGFMISYDYECLLSLIIIVWYYFSANELSIDDRDEVNIARFFLILSCQCFQLLSCLWPHKYYLLQINWWQLWRE